MVRVEKEINGQIKVMKIAEADLNYYKSEGWTVSQKTEQPKSIFYPKRGKRKVEVVQNEDEE